MNRHLSSQQMSEWVVGNSSPEMERHLHECPACRAEADRFGEALVGFRDSVHRYSEKQLGVELPRVPRLEESRPWASFRSLRWARVAVAVFAVAGFWAVLHHSEQEVAVPAATDLELLQQVDQAVSRSVPPSLKPLGELVSWEGASQAESAAPERTLRRAQEE
jgi:hypothetical protein